MKKIILDTNICLAYLRGAPVYQEIQSRHNLLDPETVPIISVVTKAELLSIALQNGWGEPKISALRGYLDRLVIIDINNENNLLMDAYKEIDAFSKDKLPGKPLGLSARNMGKNDLWIAATAYAAGAYLLTKNGDFDHLNNIYFTVLK